MVSRRRRDRANEVHGNCGSSHNRGDECSNGNDLGSGETNA